MAIGDIYQLGVNQTHHAVNLANVYAFEQITDVTGGTNPATSLMQAWAEVMVPLQADFESAQWAMTCLTARALRPTSGPLFFLADTTAGDVIGESNAANTCCLGSFYSGLGVGRGRGRKFYSGVPITANQGGRLTAASMGILQTFLNRLLSTIKWTADNGQWLLKIISTLDLVVRDINSVVARPRLTKLSSRTALIC